MDNMGIYQAPVGWDIKPGFIDFKYHGLILLWIKINFLINNNCCTKKLPFKNSQIIHIKIHMTSNSLIPSFKGYVTTSRMGLNWDQWYIISFKIQQHDVTVESLLYVLALFMVQLYYLFVNEEYSGDTLNGYRV